MQLTQKELLAAAVTTESDRANQEKRETPIKSPASVD
jgi:hypothetical protein